MSMSHVWIFLKLLLYTTLRFLLYVLFWFLLDFTVHFQYYITLPIIRTVWKKVDRTVNFYYSKALRYTASRSADLGDTRFLIGSQNTWDARILAKSLEDTRFLIFLVKKIMPIHFIEYKVFQFLWLDYFVSQVYFGTI